MKALLIGPYPPPFGGISVHVRRLQKHLQQLGHDAEVLDPYGGPLVSDLGVQRMPGKSFRGLLRFLLHVQRFDGEVLHAHVSAMDRFLYVGELVARIAHAQVKVISIHGGNFVARAKQASPVEKWLLKRLLQVYDHVMVANEVQREFLITLLGKGRADRITVVPAFLAPHNQGEWDDHQAWQRFDAFRKKFRRLVVAAGSRERQYGFEDLLQATEMSTDEQLGTILVFYRIADPSYSEEIDKLIGTRDDVMIFTDLGPDDFVRLLGESDVFVRPTHYDGDSVAVREAHYVGLQVIATNVVVRPLGTLLYDQGNIQQLFHGLQRTDEDASLGRLGEVMPSNATIILEIYDRLLK